MSEWREPTKEETDAAYRKLMREAVARSPFKPLPTPPEGIER